MICYVKSTLPALKRMNKMQKTMTVYVETNTKPNKTTIATIYRPPKSQAADDIGLFEEIKSVIQNKQAVIIGDFNCPSIDWTPMNGEREGNRLIEMADDAFLTQTVTQPTQENNILDLLSGSNPNLIRYLKVGEKICSCDHHLIRFNVKTKYMLTDDKTKIPDYKKANFNRARQLISPGTWNHLNFTHVATAWTDFKNKLLEVERVTVRMKTWWVNGTLNPLWMTKDIKRAVN